MFDPPLPPTNLRFMGASDEEFLTVGDTLAGELRQLAGLQPDDAIIDIGSGYGRLAHALIRAGHRGQYTGLDILGAHVEWCATNLTPVTGGRYRFEHRDIQNDRYNPSGKLRATEIDLTIGEPADVVILASVFTHMKPAAVEHYVSQLPKLVRDSGRVLATFFLINESQQELEENGASGYPLSYELTPYCRYWSEADPLHVIAYDQAWIENLVDRAGLATRAIHLGSWCGRRQAGVYQDTLILQRA